MPQLRQDRFTKEWVFVATEYVKHPQDLIVKRTEKRLAAFDPYCPFFPGNETQTPAEVLRVSSPSKCGRRVRVVPNKFTGLVADAGPGQTIKRFRRMVEGSGIYEVIVETPDHSLTTALLPEAHVASVCARPSCATMSLAWTLASLTPHSSRTMGPRRGPRWSTLIASLSSHITAWTLAPWAPDSVCIHC